MFRKSGHDKRYSKGFLNTGRGIMGYINLFMGVRGGYTGSAPLFSTSPHYKATIKIVFFDFH